MKCIANGCSEQAVVKDPNEGYCYFHRQMVGMEKTPTSLLGDSILQEAERIVAGPRAETYGDPRVMGERIGKIWGAILDCEVSPEQVQLCMIGLKVARECNKPGRDNLVDIAGYAQVLDKVINDVKVAAPLDGIAGRMAGIMCPSCGHMTLSSNMNCSGCGRILPGGVVG